MEFVTNHLPWEIVSHWVFAIIVMAGFDGFRKKL